MRDSRLKELIVPFVATGVLFLGVPLPAHAGRTVRCESQGRNRHYCRIGVHGQVHLQRQLSRAGCIQGQTWGEDGGGIWVSGGCRAEFWIDDIPNYDDSWMHGGDSSYGSSSGGNIRCESQGRGHHYCSAYTGNGIHLVRQLSRSECVYQRSWGYDSGGIWVSDGCRAEFSTGGGSWAGGGSYDGNTVRCESQGKNRSYCHADTSGGVSLARQLSRAACIQGRSWGYDGGGVWVDDGCRGEFHLGYRGHDGGGSHKHHNNTAAVAAGALVLGALVAVAATSGSKDKHKVSGTSHAASGKSGDSSWVGPACRAAVQQKILDHYGEETVVRFGTTGDVSSSGNQHRVSGTGTVTSKGKSWDISYTCVVDDAGGTVLEAHVMD